LEGGCQVPIAGLGRMEGADLILEGLVAELDGSRVIRDEIRGPKDRPEDLGAELGKRLLSAGAEEILSKVYGSL